MERRVFYHAGSQFAYCPYAGEIGLPPLVASHQAGDAKRGNGKLEVQHLRQI